MVKTNQFNDTVPGLTIFVEKKTVTEVCQIYLLEMKAEY